MPRLAPGESVRRSLGAFLSSCPSPLQVPEGPCTPTMPKRLPKEYFVERIVWGGGTKANPMRV
eukprot:34988-Prymnesium_polylepis.1